MASILLIDLYMKRFISLILILTTMLTFIQKATAFAPLLESETDLIANCEISTSLNQTLMDMNKIECDGNEMSNTMDCQSYCSVMTIVYMPYFIEHEYSIYQPQLQITYPTGVSAFPYYFSENLYRPPILS